MRKECHPLLSGGRRSGEHGKYSHGFSSAEMQSLASVCEALLPALPLNDFCFEGKEEQPTNKAVQSFQKASGVQTPIPDEVAELLVKRAFIEAVVLVRVVLWVLSTRLGTLLLCGSLCFGERWPFILNFSSLSLEKREGLLQKWFKHRFLTPIRLAFVYIKFLCLYIFFSRVDKNAENPVWQAIGYHVDTDDQNTPTAPKERPLQKGIIETIYETDTTLLHSLAEKGLTVRHDPQENLYKIECDVVVVGSGCGGGVAAAVLASSGQKVIVLEKGNYFTHSDYSSLEGPSQDQMYESGGIFATIDGKLVIQAGSTVGGGSAVNWSACIRTPDNVLEEWAKDHEIRFFGEPEYVSAMDTNIKSGSLRKKKCSGVLAKSLSNNISKKLQIEAKVTISACGALLTPPLMISSGLKNKNIGRNLHLHPVLMAWGYFPESNSEFKGKIYEGGIITSVHKVASADSKVKAIIETPALGPGSFSSLCPWESGEDIKKRMLKYGRTCHLISIIRDRGSGIVMKGGRVSYEFEASDKENLKAGLRQALRILIAAGAVEVGTHRSDGLRIKCKGIEKEELEEFFDMVHLSAPIFLWMYTYLKMDSFFPNASTTLREPAQAL
ncbi:hypothetical protein ACE6H2_000411 [Prunus campanulata]